MEVQVCETEDYNTEVSNCLMSSRVARRFVKLSVAEPRKSDERISPEEPGRHSVNNLEY